MISKMYIFGILLLGFVIYWVLRDRLFPADEGFEHPAYAGLEVRQAPIYPPRTVTPSGPNPPNQAAPEDEVVIHGEPSPKDPYHESQESSAIPENLRHPERSFRPPPMNDNVNIASEAGIASQELQIVPQNIQKYSTEFTQGGGEFMEGVFANDTYSDTNYSAF
jgi:hypothetical protein